MHWKCKNKQESMQYEMMMIYNVQLDKILTDTDITSPHLKRVELEAKI